MRSHHIVTMELDVDNSLIGEDDMWMRLADVIERDSAFHVVGFPGCTDANFTEEDSSKQMARKNDDAMRLHGERLIKLANLH